MNVLGLLAFISAIVSSLQDQELKYGWTGIIGGHYYNEKTIPFDSYTTVAGDGITTNPLFGNNDIEQRWIGNSSATYANSFDITNEEFIAERILMVFEGVDTYAKIKINDHIIGTTDNMFRRYIYDVKDFLHHPGQNQISIEFESAVKVAERLYNDQAKNYTIYPKCVPSSYNGECHVNHIRKMQAAFSWDWGPALPAAGLHSTPKLIAINGAKMLDTSTDIELLNSTHWQVTSSVHIENTASSTSASLRVAVIDQDKEPYEIISKIDVIDLKTAPKTFIKTIVLDIPIDNIRKWWPNGYGNQALYNQTVSFKVGDNPVQTHSRMIGFRKVELVQEPLSKGLSFYFRVNDVPIFAKGTNMIPISLLSNVNRKVTSAAKMREHLVKYMYETHMNMVRVWGGGIYEIDEFYEAADRLGIMVWQDFMFACAMYPTTPVFLESVREEVRYQVWRLKSHPSVVLWAGNNENEAALYGNWYGTGKQQVYKDDYIMLYVDLIKNEIQKIDKTRPYLVSSPTNGDYSEKNGYVLTNPYSNLYGDIHYYNYVANGWNANTYKRARFSSEYGFQSLPSYKSLQSFTRYPEQDLVMGSDFMKHRQHLPAGDILMKNQIKQNLNIPNTDNPTKDFQNYIYLSQIHQAVAVQVQTESYRQARSTINEVGEGNTMGALYWQLNDVWAAPTWSSIDYEERWKMLHYYAESFFAPVIVSPRVNLDELKIFVISDLMMDLQQCQVEVNVWHLQTRRKFTKIVDVRAVKANSSMEIAEYSIEKLLMDALCGDNAEEAKKNCIIELIIRDSNHKQLNNPNYVYPVPPKDMNIPTCQVSFRNTMKVALNVPDRLKRFYDGWEIEINSSCTQLFVWLDGPAYGEGRFSENGFHLFESSKKIIYLQTPSGTIPTLRDVTITSLGSIYT